MTDEPPSDAELTDPQFDRALIAAAFNLAAAKGWHRMSIAEAARNAGLPLDRARERFPGRDALLLRFGRLADQAALAETPSEGTVRDRLFDLIMRRIDFLQLHRAGVLALLRALRADPAVAMLLGCASRRSLGWLLDAIGIPTAGITGRLRICGLMAVWLWTIRAWRQDEGLDLAHTMAALDTALSRAEGPASWLDRPSRTIVNEPGQAASNDADAGSDAPYSPPPEPAG